MKETLRQKLHETPLDRLPVERRKQFRLVPQTMVATFTEDRDQGDSSHSVRVVDFSLGGVAIKCMTKPRDGEAGFVTLYYGRWEVHRLPAMVANVLKEGGFYRVGLKFNTKTATYRLQKDILEQMEFECIERGLF